MDLQKSNMTVLAQIVKLIPAKIIDSLAKKYKIQTRAFSPTSHIVTLLYEPLAHSLSLNDVCDSLQLRLAPLAGHKVKVGKIRIEKNREISCFLGVYFCKIFISNV